MDILDTNAHDIGLETEALNEANNLNDAEAKEFKFEGTKTNKNVFKKIGNIFKKKDNTNKEEVAKEEVVPTITRTGLSGNKKITINTPDNTPVVEEVAKEEVVDEKTPTKTVNQIPTTPADSELVEIDNEDKKTPTKTPTAPEKLAGIRRADGESTNGDSITNPGSKESKESNEMKSVETSQYYGSGEFDSKDTYIKESFDRAWIDMKKPIRFTFHASADQQLWSTPEKAMEASKKAISDLGEKFGGKFYYAANNANFEKIINELEDKDDSIMNALMITGFPNRGGLTPEQINNKKANYYLVIARIADTISKTLDNIPMGGIDEPEKMDLYIDQQLCRIGTTGENVEDRYGTVVMDYHEGTNNEGSNLSAIGNKKSENGDKKPGNGSTFVEKTNWSDLDKNNENKENLFPGTKEIDYRTATNPNFIKDYLPGSSLNDIKYIYEKEKENKKLDLGGNREIDGYSPITLDELRKELAERSLKKPREYTTNDNKNTLPNKSNSPATGIERAQEFPASTKAYELFPTGEFISTDNSIKERIARAAPIDKDKPIRFTFSAKTDQQLWPTPEKAMDASKKAIDDLGKKFGGKFHYEANNANFAKIINELEDKDHSIMNAMIANDGGGLTTEQRNNQDANYYLVIARLASTISKTLDNIPMGGTDEPKYMDFSIQRIDCRIGTTGENPQDRRGDMVMQYHKGGTNSEGSNLSAIGNKKSENGDKKPGNGSTFVEKTNWSDLDKNKNNDNKKNIFPGTKEIDYRTATNPNFIKDYLPGSSLNDIKDIYEKEKENNSDGASLLRGGVDRINGNNTITLDELRKRLAARALKKSREYTTNV